MVEKENFALLFHEFQISVLDISGRKEGRKERKGRNCRKVDCLLATGFFLGTKFFLKCGFHSIDEKIGVLLKKERKKLPCFYSNSCSEEIKRNMKPTESFFFQTRKKASKLNIVVIQDFRDELL